MQSPLFCNTFHCFHNGQTVAPFLFFFSQHAIDCTLDSQHGGGLFSESLIHELTNAGFNILNCYVEDNLSRIICGLRVDFTITDDVQKPQCIFSSRVPGNGSMKPLIC